MTKLSWTIDLRLNCDAQGGHFFCLAKCIQGTQLRNSSILILVAHLEKQPFARGMEMGFRHVIKYFPHGFSDLVKPAGADDNRGGFTRRQSFDIIHIEFAAHI